MTAAVYETSFDDIRPGELFAEFKRGAVAAVVRCNGNVQQLWSRLLADSSERLPWEGSLADIARNYHGNPDVATSLGDMFYFQPGQHGYIARKLEITRTGANGRPEANPSRFVQDDGYFEQQDETLSDCCALVDRIMLGISPGDAGPRPYDVVVQRLKYEDSFADIMRLSDMVSNSLGRLGRAGSAADRVRASGPIRPRRLAGLLALASLIPRMGSAAGVMGRKLGQAGAMGGVEGNAQVIERPHVDMRYFSALCGSRDSIRTQAFAGGNWVDVPVDLGGVTILPARLATDAFGLAPTMHRVLHDEANGNRGADRRTGNVTLLLGAK